MKFNLFISLVMAVLLSVVTSKIVYFGFTPNYANDIFSRKAYAGRHDHDVYKYRILGKYLVYVVDGWLGQSMPEKGAELRLLVGTRDASERFYLALYYLNTFFLALTSIMVVLLLDLEGSWRFTIGEKNLIIFLVPVLISLTEFTVSVYDVSSFFFQLLILYIFLRYSARHYMATMLVIAALIVLSTLNRETSSLSVSMISLLLLTRYGITRKSISGIAGMAVCFLATYIGLRYFVVDPQHLRIVNLQAGKLFIDTNIIGLIFWALFFYLPMAIADSAENKWLIGVFFLFSLPYILTCLKDGVLWEVRLYIPMFLGALFLSKLDVSAAVLKISDLKIFSRGSNAIH
jgi:hypothetical protein